MKRHRFFVLGITALMAAVWLLNVGCAGSPAPFELGIPGYYVSANGNDNNNGLSAASPFKTLGKAIAMAESGDINTIAVIGTLNAKSEQVAVNHNVATFFTVNNDPDREITITGSPNAAGGKRAVLTGKGTSKQAVLYASVGKFRLEHIEISGGKDLGGWPLQITKDAQVTLGPGVLIQSSPGPGIVLEEGICIIDGGEVVNNTNRGVNILYGGTLYLLDGLIAGNKGGGVYVSGTFIMKGGIIRGNRTTSNGAGVRVTADSAFEKGPPSGMSESGIIYGKNEGNDSNIAGDTKGHAVWWDSGSQYRDTTLSATDHIGVDG